MAYGSKNSVRASFGNRDACASNVDIPSSITPARWYSQASANAVHALSHSVIPIPAFASRRSPESPSQRPVSAAIRFSVASNATVAK